jgi:leader peptidase (prepilin peptidase)/N-methyltransferase
MVLFITWLLSAIGLLALLVYDYKWMLLPNRILYPTALVSAAGRLIYIAGFSDDKTSDLVQWLLAIGVASGIFWLLFMVSSGKWIGYGDVRLGLITGTVLATPSKSFLMIFIASLLGTAAVLPALLSGKQRMTGRIPFGPFLIVSTFITLLIGQQIIDWYQGLLL